MQKYCRKRAQIDDQEKKKKQWTIYIEQTKSTVAFTHSPNKCHNIFTKYLFLVVVGHQKKKKRWTVHIEQTKSIVTFTHLPNKCHNIFTKHLFSVVVGHSFIFYYFILTYKKLTPQ